MIVDPKYNRLHLKIYPHLIFNLKHIDYNIYIVDIIFIEYYNIFIPG